MHSGRSICYDYVPFQVGLENSIVEIGTLEEYGLVQLANNGGPTQIMALLPGSPAIDAGEDNIREETDHRVETVRSVRMSFNHLIPPP
jgi:hypothetical protein